MVEKSIRKVMAMKNEKPFKEDEYTFVEERIVSKRHRVRRVLTKIFVDLFVPACVCLLVCYIYINTIGDDKEDETIEPVETTSENSIVVNGNNNGDEQSVQNEPSTDMNNEEYLIQLEETIKKMVVVVSVVRDDAHNADKYTGVVVSMNGPVYILIPYENIEGYKEINTYVGEEAALPTTVYDIDDATGLAMLKIEDAKITRAHRKMLEVATFEGINQVDAGSSVVYCGSVVGNSPMFMKGNISNTSNYVTCIDLAYNVLITDIVLEEAQDGFLFNSKGNLVGIVGMELGDIELPAFVAGARALDLKYIINNMLNDKKDIYFGITGQAVSAKIEAIAGGSMPKGIYVSSVLIDSPAYNAGIMAGDIIFMIDGLYEPDMNVFRNYIERRTKGDSIQIKVKRKIGNEYNEYSMTVTLNSRD